jgi:hypothetical protein
MVGDRLQIRDRASHGVTWRATSGAAWLTVTPAGGRLATGGTATATARVASTSPEGPVQATVTVSADDGSAAATTYATTVERPPDVAASIDGCSVTATADDDSGVATVELHWTSGGSEHVGAMAATASGYMGSVPESTPLTWWVVARDTRGNTARTAPATATC